jgi:hypothetical protein
VGFNETASTNPEVQSIGRCGGGKVPRIPAEKIGDLASLLADRTVRKHQMVVAFALPDYH